MTVAAIAWHLTPLESEAEFWERLTMHVRLGVEHGAQAVCLPELIDLELLSLRPDLTEDGHAAWLSGFHQQFRAAGQGLAKSQGIQLFAGSVMAEAGDGFVNRAMAWTPSGEEFWQDKLVLTEFEKSPWGLSPGGGLRRQPEPFAQLICYDAEFPEAGRAAAESGAKVLVVPTYTETEHGQTRVETGCAARALENEVFVVMPALRGRLNLPGYWPFKGRPLIFAPPKPPFPASGRLFTKVRGKAGSLALLADLDFEALAECRASGDVRPWRDRAASHWQYES